MEQNRFNGNTSGWLPFPTGYPGSKSHDEPVLCFPAAVGTGTGSYFSRGPDRYGHIWKGMPGYVMHLTLPSGNGVVGNWDGLFTLLDTV